MSAGTAQGNDPAPQAGKKRGPKPLPLIVTCPQICRDCRAELPPAAFYRDPASGRLQRACRDCERKRRRDRARERYQNDPAYRALTLERARAYQAENREYLRRYARDYYAANRERLNDEARERRRMKKTAQDAAK